MSILVDKNTKVIVQGLTGKTGSFHTEQALAYYGTQIHDYLDEGSKLTCPTLFHMADHDSFIKDEDVKAIFQALFGIPYLAVLTYDTGHAFANWDRPGVYDEDLAEKAHARTFAVFDKLKQE